MSDILRHFCERSYWLPWSEPVFASVRRYVMYVPPLCSIYSLPSLSFSNAKEYNIGEDSLHMSAIRMVLFSAPHCFCLPFPICCLAPFTAMCTSLTCTFKVFGRYTRARDDGIGWPVIGWGISMSSSCFNRCSLIILHCMHGLCSYASNSNDFKTWIEMDEQINSRDYICCTVYIRISLPILLLTWYVPTI